MHSRTALSLLFALAATSSADASVGPAPRHAEPLPKVSKQEQPKAQIPPVRYTLKVQFVRTADAGGARPSELTRAGADAWIAEANRVFRRNGGDVQFVIHSASNFDDLLKNTALNRDCVLAAGQTANTIAANTDSSIDPDTLCDSDASKNARTAYGLERGDRIVVFSRGGNQDIAWHEDGHWYLKDKTGGQSWGDQTYVTMPHDYGSSTLLAHELGHYFHNPHTFNDGLSIATVANAKAAMESWVAEHPDDHPSRVFDGDALRSGFNTSDTPPDPRGSVLLDAYNAAHPAPDIEDKCHADVGSVTIGVRVGGQTQQVTLTPDRTNIMSYFKGCPFPQKFSKDQYANIHHALATNRADLVEDTGGCYSSGSGGGVVTTEDGLRDTMRKVAACLLLVKRPMPWEEVMGTIYSQPGDLKPGFTKAGKLGVHKARETTLLKKLRSAPPMDE